MKKPKDIDEFITGFPPEIQQLLQQVRTTIKNAVPEAEEVISYGMPAFKLNGILVWFAAFKNHIGFYPFPNGIDAFKEELSKYKRTKGSIHFPFDEPLPLELISRIAVFRMTENQQKSTTIKK